MTYPLRVGDWFVVNTGTRMTRPITLLERFDDMVEHSKLKWTDFDHAGVCVDIETRPPGVYLDGTGEQKITIMEAGPSGAHARTWHYQDRPHLWSSGLIAWPDPRAGEDIAQAALDLDGTRYGWLDYAALTAHALHIPVPGLREFIKSTHTMICSQLVDYACLTAGVHLFTDPPRWEGYVKPSDLGALIAP